MTIDVTTRGTRVWNLWRIAGWSIPAILLALPAIAMRYTNEVDWDVADFIVMGALFGSIGLGIEFLIRQSDSLAYRAGAVAALVTSFLIIWINAAVGMIGSENNPYNLVFGGVLLVALTGAVLARFQAAGMARAMVVAATAQAAVGLGGISMDLRDGVFSAGFAILWLIAATLFRAARPAP
jgi:hypothetical protein